MLEEAKQNNYYKAMYIYKQKNKVKHCQAPAVPKSEAAFSC